MVPKKKSEFLHRREIHLADYCDIQWQSSNQSKANEPDRSGLITHSVMTQLQTHLRLPYTLYTHKHSLYECSNQVKSKTWCSFHCYVFKGWEQTTLKTEQLRP